MISLETNNLKKLTPKTETCRAIVFKIAGHLLALPVQSVFRVISTSFLTSSNVGGTKLVHLDNKTLPILNLHQLLAHIKPSNSVVTNSLSLNQQQFLLLAHSQPGKLSAIVVDEPPTLREISLTNTYLLPHSYQANIEKIATHVAVIPDKNANTTILLLDLEKATIKSGFAQTNWQQNLALD